MLVVINYYSLHCIFIYNIIYSFIFKSRENSQKPLAFAYYCGLAIIFFFLGFTSIFLMIMMAIYRSINNFIDQILTFYINLELYIIDSPNVKDYEKAFVLLFGGYTLGCLYF